MSSMTDILTLEVTKEAPLISGDYFIETRSDRTRPDVVDTRYRSKKKVGRKMWARFADDFGLIINDSLWSANSSNGAVFRGDGLYILSLRLSGNCIETVNSNTYSLGAYTCSMIRYEKGVRHAFRMLPEEPLVEVCVCFRASFFFSRYRMSVAEADMFLHPSRCSESDPWFSQCPMTPKIEAIVRDLRGASPFQATWRIFAEAKTLELISLYLTELGQNAARGETRSLPVNEMRGLRAAREYLRLHYNRSPHIDELCRLVGVNRRKLTTGFKAGFGETIFGYTKNLQMEQARALFQNGLTDVKQVATRVGYGHQSNFTKAFKKHFGITPTRFMLAAQAAPKEQPKRADRIRNAPIA
jgi:AraC-like DNA-binding protein